MERGSYEGMAAAEADHWWYVGRRAIIASELRRLQLPADAKIIEVGAGTGGNLEMLRGFGTLSASELDAPARALANAKGICVVEEGRLPDGLPFAPASADLIGLFDVLEHVEDDAASLRALHEILKPGGRLVVTVPAYQWLWSRHDEMLHHFRRYARRELGERLGAAGFTVRRLTHFNSVLFPAAVAVRVLNLRGADGRSVGGKTPSPPLNAALRGVLGLEAGLLRHLDLPVGLSLLAVAEKR